MHTLTKYAFVLCTFLSIQGCRDVVIGGSPEDAGDASSPNDTRGATMDDTNDTDSVSDTDHMDSGVQHMDTDDWHMDSEDWDMDSEDWDMGSDRDMGREGSMMKSD